MFVVIGFMLSGAFLGFVFRKTKINWIQKLITLFIWLLLFLLGIEAGSNESVVTGLGTIGLEALIITVAAMLGSCLLALALWKYLNKDNNKEKDKESEKINK